MSFVVLAVPFIFLSISILLAAAFSVAAGEPQSLPIAGSGLFFAFLGIFMLFNGALGELVNRMGQSNVTGFPVVTAREISADSDGSMRMPASIGNDS